MGRRFLSSASHDWVLVFLLAFTVVCTAGLAVIGYVIHSTPKPCLVVTYQSIGQYPETIQHSPDVSADASSVSNPAPLAVPNEDEPQEPAASEGRASPGGGTVRASFTVVP